MFENLFWKNNIDFLFIKIFFKKIKIINFWIVSSLEKNAGNINY